PVCIVALSVSGAGRCSEVPLKPIKVPFELVQSQHIVVAVKVNGEGPYRLILDTGAPLVLVSSKLARAAGVIPGDVQKPAGALLGSAGELKIKLLEVGEVEARALPVLVLDHPTVRALSKVVGP